MDNDVLISIRNCLSESRLRTYDLEFKHLQVPEQYFKSWALYEWNLQLSEAFILPIHYAEISLRNSIVRKFELIYGINWLSSKGFLNHLSNKEKIDIEHSLSIGKRTTNQIIPECSFGFWKRRVAYKYFDSWRPHLKTCFPNLQSPDINYGCLYTYCEDINVLRNRIAHHEPIYKRDLELAIQQIIKIIEFSSLEVANYVRKKQQITELITHKPW